MKKYFSGTAIPAILACLLWSSAFAGVKIGLKYTTPLQFAGIRFFISGIMLFPFCGGLSRILYFLKKYRHYILLVGFLQTFLGYALFYTGINKVPGALAALIIGSSPLFAALTAHFAMADDKISKGKLVSILVGLVGVAIISFGRKGFMFNGGVELLGIGILILNNIIGGFVNVVIKRRQGQVPPMILSSFSMSLGGLGLFLFSIPVEGFTPTIYPTEYYVALAWLSFLSAAAFSLWYTLLQKPGVKISTLNMWKFIIPVSGAILSWSILPDETPDLVSIIGMLIIGCSLLLLNHAIRKERTLRNFRTPESA